MAYRRKKPARPIPEEELPPVIEEPQPETPIDEPLMIQKIDNEVEIEIEKFEPEEQVVNLDFFAPPPDYTFWVQVTVTSLRKRRSPSYDGEIIGYITDQGTYRIMETRDKWGQLGDGSWIDLNFTERV